MARINEHCPPRIHSVLPIIKGKWFNETDLQEILSFYDIKVENKYIDHCSPKDDLVQVNCSKQNDAGVYMYSKGLCKSDCPNYSTCNIKDIPKNICNSWQTKNYFDEYLSNNNWTIDQKDFTYQNADYGAVMYFYNNSFKGAYAEKKVMVNLLNKSSISLFHGDDTEIKLQELKQFNGFLTSLLNAEVGVEVIAFISYIQSEPKLKIEGTDTDIAKAIYRMTCIGLIEDFTQDYSQSQYRIVSIRRKEGEYYEALENFLRRYYTADRAHEEIKNVYHYKLNLVSENALQNEIYRCLGYLTEFVYDKISTKRKRAINDMRNFCLQGIDESKDWKEINEELKDSIYFYFNSKYAKDDNLAANGESYSLTKDTNGGKESSVDILFKYLGINEPDIIGSNMPIDNVKHLQGAVRLIRRSLTDQNPSISLLNTFCLLFLGTKDNENLEHELHDSYIEGMTIFEDRIKNSVEFWDMFDKYNESISKFSNQEQLSNLKKEVILKIHSQKLKNITDQYLQ